MSIFLLRGGAFFFFFFFRISLFRSLLTKTKTIKKVTHVVQLPLKDLELRGAHDLVRGHQAEADLFAVFGLEVFFVVEVERLS